jgi:hypothetical protein
MASGRGDEQAEAGAEAVSMRGLLKNVSPTTTASSTSRVVRSLSPVKLGRYKVLVSYTSPYLMGRGTAPEGRDGGASSFLTVGHV